MRLTNCSIAKSLPPLPSKIPCLTIHPPSLTVPDRHTASNCLSPLTPFTSCLFGRVDWWYIPPSPSPYQIMFGLRAYPTPVSRCMLHTRSGAKSRSSSLFGPSWSPASSSFGEPPSSRPPLLRVSHTLRWSRCILTSGDEYKNDPRNPYGASTGHWIGHTHLSHTHYSRFAG